jgi:hypothetical protein
MSIPARASALLVAAPNPLDAPKIKAQPVSVMPPVVTMHLFVSLPDWITHARNDKTQSDLCQLLKTPRERKGFNNFDISGWGRYNHGGVRSHLDRIRVKS